MVQDRSWDFDLDGSDEVAVTGEVSTGVSLFALTMVGAVLAGVVGLLVVFTASTEDDLIAPTTTTFPSTNSIPVPSQTLLRAPVSVATTLPPTTLVPGQFLLGEPTGLWLFYGGDDPLQRLNLDNGELVTYGLEAFPVHATGEDLMLHQGRSGVSGWVPAETPGEQASTWKEGPVAPGPEPGLLWVLELEGEMAHPSGEPVGFGRWQLFDLSDNRVIDRRPGDLYADIEAALAGTDADRYRVSPDYSNRPDGIYRYGDEGYRRIAAGRAVAAVGTLVFASSCTAIESFAAEPGFCRSTWLDGETGVASAGPIPAPEWPIVSARLWSSGRWLVVDDLSGRTTLIEVASGERRQLNLTGVAVSPDGRWLAGLSGGELVIEDLLGINPPFRYELPGSSGAGTLLIAERTVGE